ncbi:MAG: MerR family transcriptional regulator [Faecalibacillus sp.]
MKLDIPISTIRYYDKEGFLPFVERKPSGFRQFSDDDIILLETMNCMKQLGMSLSEMKELINEIDKNDKEKQYYLLFKKVKEMITEKINCLSEMKIIFDKRCAYYQKNDK